MNENQTHLDRGDTVNYGGYYTPEPVVEMVYGLLEKNVPAWSRQVILDTSCGYGQFLRTLGADLDPAALKEAARRAPEARLFPHNSLAEVSRAQYGLADENSL